MKERHILFSAQMVRAILDGRKTQTRRVVKPRPDDDAIITVGEIGTSRGAAYVRYPESGGLCGRLPCPYGAPGDRLWVRETCRAMRMPSQGWGVRYLADLAWRPFAEAEEMQWYGKRASPAATINTVPAIHMPRWAARINLVITAVRVERLQDISIADAIAEGVGIRCDSPMAVMEYSLLWESINGRGSWDANPWVWVIEFIKIKPESNK